MGILKAAALASLASLLLAPAAAGQAESLQPVILARDSPPRRAGGRVYRVHVGPYPSRPEAAEVCGQLAASNIAAFVLPGEQGFTVQVGAYRIRRSAERIAQILGHAGLAVRVVGP